MDEEFSPTEDLQKAVLAGLVGENVPDSELSNRMRYALAKVRDEWFDGACEIIWKSARAYWYAAGAMPPVDDFEEMLSRRPDISLSRRSEYSEVFRELRGSDVSFGRLRFNAVTLGERWRHAAFTESLQATLRIAHGSLVGGDTSLSGYADANTFLNDSLAKIRQTQIEALEEGNINREAHLLRGEYERAKLGGRIGIFSGFGPFDSATNGLHPGELVLIAGFSGEGKALDIATPIPTPDGWTTMGEIAIGDGVFDERGMPCYVIGVSKIRYDRQCYLVKFNDGSEITADAQHLWAVLSGEQRHRISNKLTSAVYRSEPQILTTEKLAEKIKFYDRYNYSIDVSGPLHLHDRVYSVPPYILGAWLGDGSTADGSITTADQEIVEQFASEGYPLTKHAEKYGYGTKGLLVRLRELNVLHNKHVPFLYLRGSFAQRLALLQGLMDTDGYISGRGQCEFTSTCKAIADGCLELILSLGIKASIHEGRAKLYGVDHGPKYRIAFTTNLPVFRLSRKLAKIPSSVGNQASRRWIVDVVPVKSVPVKCIVVDSESRLFLAGSTMIPTHNSATAYSIAYNACYVEGRNVIFGSAEVSRSEVRRHFAVRHSHNPKFNSDGVHYTDVKDGTLSSEEEDFYKNVVLPDLDNTPHGQMYVFPVPHRETVQYVENKLAEKSREFDVDLVVVDYLGLLGSGSRRPNRREELNDILIAAKRMATDAKSGAGVAVVSPWQISRAAWERAKEGDHFYTKTALAETSEAERSPDLILSLLREDSTAKKLKAQILKNRDGTEGAIFDLYTDFSRCLVTDHDPYPWLLPGG